LSERSALEIKKPGRLMIHATVKMKIPVQKAGEVMEILRSVAERTRVQPGCVSCRVYHDTQEGQLILFEETWSTQQDLNKHLRSEEYRNVLLVIEMADEKPEILFNPLADSTGMETIEKARARNS
jgi:quinol monooxygenase YgiN